MQIQPLEIKYLPLNRLVQGQAGFGGVYCYRPGRGGLMLINSDTFLEHQDITIGDFFSKYHLKVDPAKIQIIFRFSRHFYESLEELSPIVLRHRLVAIHSKAYPFSERCFKNTSQQRKHFEQFAVTFKRYSREAAAFI